MAIALALALSPSPLSGWRAEAELRPGVAADWPVLVAGSVAIVGMVAVCAVLAAQRAARTRGDALGQLEQAGAGRPVPGGRCAGICRGAAERAVTRCASPSSRATGRTAVPVRAAPRRGGRRRMHRHCGGWLRRGRHPAGYGVTWDVTVGGFASAAAAEPVAGRLIDNPSVTAVTGELGLLDAAIDGQYVPLTAMEERKEPAASGVDRGPRAAAARRDRARLGNPSAPAPPGGRYRDADRRPGAGAAPAGGWPGSAEPRELRGRRDVPG